MRSALLAFVALASLVLVAACGGKDEPQAPTQPAPAATPTPSNAPTPTPGPVTPEPGKPEAPKPEPTFRPMGMPDAAAPHAAPSAAAAGKRLVGAWAKGDKPPTAGSAQVTMQNNTSMTLDLYVDGGYGCRALRNLMCTTQVTPGTLTLEVRGPNGESASTVQVVESGSSFTWTITEE